MWAWWQHFDFCFSMATDFFPCGQYTAISHSLKSLAGEINNIDWLIPVIPVRGLGNISKEVRSHFLCLCAEEEKKLNLKIWAISAKSRWLHIWVRVCGEFSVCQWSKQIKNNLKKVPWSEGSCLLFHRVASWVLHLQNIRIKYRKKVPDISLDVTLTHSKYLNFAEVTIKALNGSYIVFLHKLQIHINLSTFCLCDNQDDNVGSSEYGLSQTTLFRPRDWSTTNYWVMREKWVAEGCWQSQENW